MPDQITIEDLEVRFHVGVPDEERAEPQRLRWPSTVDGRWTW